MGKDGFIWAADAEGNISKCFADEENRGKGRCNHIYHQNEGESLQDFSDRVAVKVLNIIRYKMSDEEIESLPEATYQAIKEDMIDDGKITITSRGVWAPADIQEFASHLEVSPTNLERVLYDFDGKNLYCIKDGKVVPYSDKSGNIICPDGERGCFALNNLAEQEEFDTTRHIYFLPRSVRKGLPYMDIDSDATMLYLSLIRNNKTVKDSESVEDREARIQKSYARLLDNENVSSYGINPDRTKVRQLWGIKKLLEGKSGYIRSQMTAYNIPYSGRSVIEASDSSLPYGHVSIPLRIAVCIYEPTIREFLGKNPKNSKEDISDWLESVKRGENTENACRIINDIVESEGVNCLAIRQPALHSQSIICFKPTVRNESVTRINPLFCKGYNADFDGDTFQILGINDRELSEEAYENLGPDNPFSYIRGTTGKSSFQPTKDSLFGLLSTLKAWENLQKNKKN